MALSGPPVSFRTLYPRYPGYKPRRDGGLGAYETVLGRAGFAPVAGIDEAGRGACAGPLVVAAVVLDPASIRRMPGLADSKLLTPQAREEAYTEVLRRAIDWHVVVIGADQIDATGLHVCNVSGMRRAFAGLRSKPGFVLTDGFPVRGLGVPGLAVWKGDRVTASVAAASVMAKVSRDRMMRDLHERYPLYGFDRHKGYVTDEHVAALAEHGPSPVHRYSFVNVTRAAALAVPVAPADPAELLEPAELLGDAAMGDQLDRADRLGGKPARVEERQRHDDQGKEQSRPAQPIFHASRSRARAASASICALRAASPSNFTSGRK